MALSFATYFADGLNYPVPFVYLSKSHVKVSVNGVPAPFTWLSETTIRLVNLPVFPEVVEVRRETPSIERLVDFVDGSTLTERDLDLSATQTLYLSQEAQDAVSLALRRNIFSHYDFQDRRGVDVSDPIDPKDVANKRFVEEGMNSQLRLASDAVVKAATAATQAATAATQAAASALKSKEPLLPVTIDEQGFMGGLTGMAVSGTLGTRLFVRSAINIPEMPNSPGGGLLLASADPTLSVPKGLEIIGSRIQIEPSEALNIYPKPLSYAMGLNIVQSGPNYASVAGPYSFNKIDTTWRSIVTGDGTYGLSGSASVAALQVSLNIGGVDFDAHSAFGGAFGVNHLIDHNSKSDTVGLSGGVFSNARTYGTLYGGSSGVTNGPLSQCLATIGHEVDMDVQINAIVPYRFGFNSANQGVSFATTFDSAYNIMCLGFPNAANGRWKNAFTLCNLNGQLPTALAPDACFFNSDHDLTIKTWANFPTMEVTDYILNFPHVILTGKGSLQLGAAEATTNLAIGTLANPFAFLNIAPSTPTKASLIIDAGPGIAPENVRAGMVFSNGTHLYWVNSLGQTHQLDN